MLIHWFCTGLRRLLTENRGNTEEILRNLKDVRRNVPGMPWLRRSGAVPYICMAMQMEIVIAIESNDAHSANFFARLAYEAAIEGLVDFHSAHMITHWSKKAFTNKGWSTDALSELVAPSNCLIQNDIILGVKEKIETAIPSLLEEGYAIVPEFLGQNWSQRLQEDFRELVDDRRPDFQSGEMDVTGRSDQSLRGDRILWLDGLDESRLLASSLSQILQKTVLQTLRGELRKHNIYLSHPSMAITDTMLAVYSPKKKGFVKHLDSTDPEDLRKISAVYYLSTVNEENGGQLVLYPDTGKVMAGSI